MAIDMFLNVNDCFQASMITVSTTVIIESLTHPKPVQFFHFTVQIFTNTGQVKQRLLPH